MTLTCPDGASVTMADRPFRLGVTFACGGTIWVLGGGTAVWLDSLAVPFPEHLPLHFPIWGGGG